MICNFTHLLIRIIRAKIVNNLDNIIPVYAFTNENLRGCLEKLNSIPTKVLTIASRGDQLFNLVCNNVSNVDLIDINAFSEYYIFGLRIAMIRMTTFEQYSELLNYLYKDRNYNLEYEKYIWNQLFSYMDLKYRIFFEQIWYYYYHLQLQYRRNINLMQILTKDYYFNLDELTFNNNYLQNEASYLKLKANLNNLNSTFKCGDIFTAKGEYDLIMCSNVLEYTTGVNSMQNLYDLFKNLSTTLTPDGLILACYIYDIINRWQGYLEYPIGGVDISYRELLKEELIFLDNYKNGQDAILVLR